MGTINASLAGAASALDALQYALSVSQNNIDNSSTPGYARQRATLLADPFNPSLGLSGGVSTGPLQDSRDLLAEREVWQQAGSQAAAAAQNETLTAVQNALPTADGTGIPAALSGFYNAVSAWSVSPQNGSTAQTVMDAAGSVAQSFNATAAAVGHVSQSIDLSIGATVNQINSLTAQLASYNAAVQRGGQDDAGLGAQIYSTLENLAGLVNIAVLPQQDGSVQVTLSAGQALVVGSHSYALSAGSVAASANPPVDPLAPPHAAIYGADGAEVTAQINSGTLSGQLQVRNVVIPSLTGDAAQQGALNQLASAFADTVNQIVSQGFVSAGEPAASGLFVTDAAHPDAAAATLAVDPHMTAGGLPAIDSNGVPNGVPLALAALANSPQIDNVSYTGFYGNTAAAVGSRLNQAQNDQNLAQQTLAQAQSMRQTAQGVDLNAEAINIMQFQEGFQAAAKLVNTLGTLTQTLIEMIP